jgi:hypothetical protein
MRTKITNRSKPKTSGPLRFQGANGEFSQKKVVVRRLLLSNSPRKNRENVAQARLYRQRGMQKMTARQIALLAFLFCKGAEFSLCFGVLNCKNRVVWQFLKYFNLECLKRCLKIEKNAKCAYLAKN